MHNGKLTLGVNEEEVKFEVNNTLKFLDKVCSCNRIDLVLDCVKDIVTPRPAKVEK